MNYRRLKNTAFVFAMVVASTSSVYAYNAKHACINQVTEHGSSAYHGASGVHVKDRGHHSYSVTGNVKSRRDNKLHHFSCEIRHKEIVNWKVNSSHGHKNNTAAAIGVGILALAIAGAVDNHNKKHHKERYNDYDSGGNPFSDIKYLKHQCKKNIRHQLKREHGRIDRIRFDSAHLHNRKLTGTGYVDFERGGERDLSYECSFDRRGNIYDGYYRYRYRR